MWLTSAFKEKVNKSIVYSWNLYQTFSYFDIENKVLLTNIKIMNILFSPKKNMFATFIYFCLSCRQKFERSTQNKCLDHNIPYQVSQLDRKFNDLVIKQF